MTTKPKSRKAPAVAGINPMLIALAAKIDKANARAEERGTYNAVFKLDDSLAAVAAMNLEEMKLKARYVDVDCIMGLGEQIGKLPASIVRDLLAFNRKQKASASNGSPHARHSGSHPPSLSHLEASRALLGVRAAQARAQCN